MSHPHGPKIPAPASGGQSQTLLVFQGNPMAMLLSGASAKPKAMRFASEASALSWCIAHHAGMIFTPTAAPALN